MQGGFNSAFRGRRSFAAIVPVLALLMLPGSASACSDSGYFGTGSQSERALRCLLNEERADRGERGLAFDKKLARAARRHARDMIVRQFFAHTSPSGTGPLARARRAGYARNMIGTVAVGEAIGIGLAEHASPATPPWLVDMWLASPAHRSVLMDPEYENVGVGVAFFTWPGLGRVAVVVADLGSITGSPAPQATSICVGCKSVRKLDLWSDPFAVGV